MGDHNNIELPFIENKDSSSFIKDIEWKEEHEKILVDWADKAMCYRWLHSKSHQVYSYQNAWFTIPVIIMSTLTGTANFAQDRFPGEIRDYASMIIGAVNIFAGILTTIQQFLKITELNEAHRVGAISWDKFYRNIKIELAKCPEERIHVGQMLKICKEEFDRLMETSPIISDNIVKQFEESFADSNNTEELTIRHKNFMQVSKPEICDELVSTEKDRYKRPNPTVIDASNRFMYGIRKKQQAMAQIESQIMEFVKEFGLIHNRPPMKNEIIEDLQEKINFNTLETLLQKMTDDNTIIIHDENNV